MLMAIATRNMVITSRISTIPSWFWMRDGARGRLHFPTFFSKPDTHSFFPRVLLFFTGPTPVRQMESNFAERAQVSLEFIKDCEHVTALETNQQFAPRMGATV